jgi:hypothetical protein
MPRKGEKKYKDSDFYGIIKDISTTTNGLREICKKHKIDVSTFYCYIDDSEDLAERYARAKRRQTRNIFDEMITRAKSVKAEKNEIQKERLVIDTMKWVLGKLRPEKYGERVTVDVDMDIRQIAASLNITESAFLQVRDKIERGEFDFGNAKLIEADGDNKDDSQA